MTKKKKEKQLELTLPDTPKNIYYKYKNQYELWLAGIETKKFVKDPLTWFVIITSLALIATQVYTIQSKTRIPSKVPVFNYFLNPSKRLVANQYIYFFPVLSFLILLCTIALANSYYHKERELIKVLEIVCLLANISICFIFMKLVLIF
ncbi:MAG TPA: hypothetical protein PLK49_00115 [Candidatus Dojkabacteria bacterium]|nr:hypothetical protein [Candidatus Pacearchaeota archaeon]HPM13800.1 hypothetical protein [Candidatus Dojkabacteria bacterium]HQA87470.1 hypothetical protein [Candidatus Dojkabacteria bacterium]